MAELLYKERGFHTVEIKERWGKVKLLRVPFELSIEEVERLLELNDRIDSNLKVTVDDEDYVAIATQMNKIHSLLLNQCLIIFQHYQPEITIEYLKKNLTETDARNITGFFETNRYFKQLNGNAQSKKKSKVTQLTSLRRMIVFLVKNGFSLLELRKLYIDEFFEYYYETVKYLEDVGEMKENTYDKVRGIDSSTDRFEEFFNTL